jgi:hypothetical protein
MLCQAMYAFLNRQRVRSFTPHAYNAIVQVRQKVPHRRRAVAAKHPLVECRGYTMVISSKAVLANHVLYEVADR